jgi:hypothetical protein
MGDNRTHQEGRAAFPNDPFSWVVGAVAGLVLGIALGIGMHDIGGGVAAGLGIGVAFAVVLGASRADARRRHHHGPL